MPRVKRFVVFECEQYYPGGGWSDHRASFRTRKEAGNWIIENGERSQYVWYEIVDLKTGKRVSVRGCRIDITPAFLEEVILQCLKSQASTSSAKP